jgi:hypothetical protein
LWGRAREGRRYRAPGAEAYPSLRCAMLTMFGTLRYLPYKGGEEEAA